MNEDNLSTIILPLNIYENPHPYLFYIAHIMKIDFPLKLSQQNKNLK